MCALGALHGACVRSTRSYASLVPLRSCALLGCLKRHARQAVRASCNSSSQPPLLPVRPLRWSRAEASSTNRAYAMCSLSVCKALWRVASTVMRLSERRGQYVKTTQDHPRLASHALAHSCQDKCAETQTPPSPSQFWRLFLSRHKPFVLKNGIKTFGTPTSDQQKTCRSLCSFLQVLTFRSGKTCNISRTSLVQLQGALSDAVYSKSRSPQSSLSSVCTASPLHSGVAVTDKKMLSQILQPDFSTLLTPRLVSTCSKYCSLTALILGSSGQLPQVQWSFDSIPEDQPLRAPLSWENDDRLFVQISGVTKFIMFRLGVTMACCRY